MAPINIDIDIIINDNNNNFKQTSIAISAVHAHNLSSFLYNKFALSQSFSPIYVRFTLFSVGPDFGLCLLAHPSIPSLIYYRPRCPVPLSTSLYYHHSRPFPCPALPGRVRTHVRTPSTLLQLPVVTHHYPTHFLPPPPAWYSLVPYVLPFGEQCMEKQQMLEFHDVCE